MTIASPNSQTTAVTADFADWRLANLSVTASFGFDRSLTSYLDVSYGTNDSPQVSCSLSVQSVHFINEGDRPERIYPVSVSLLCPVETNGVVNISHEGSDGTLFWSDASATQPLSSLSGISLSRQYTGLTVTYSDDFHDRFLIIDNMELHGLGSSINCLGRRVTSYTTRDPKEIAKLLSMVP